MGCLVDLDASRRDRLIHGKTARPAKKRVHPCDKDLRAERLGNIFIHSKLESIEFISLLAPCRQHNNRDFGFFTDLSAHFPAIHLRTEEVAMSQGYIGIDLQNAIKYELYKRDLDMKVSTILSQVEVDENDEAFAHPTKPIGRFMTEEEAKEKEAEGIHCMEDAGRGYRVAVASPMPKRIRELETIRTLMEAGHIVITCGGGGIPVINRGGKLVGVSAVIDKDNVSSLLASKIGADYLVILTAVEKVAINFGKENQEWLSDLTVEQAKKYIAEEQFAKGSMLPKIEAAVRFAESGEGRRTLITLLEKAADGIAGKTGTVIHK